MDFKVLYELHFIYGKKLSDLSACTSGTMVRWQNQPNLTIRVKNNNMCIKADAKKVFEFQLPKMW